VQNVFGHGFSPIYKGIRQMPALLRLSFPFSAEFGNAKLSARGSRGQKPVTPARRAADFVVIQTHLRQ
jgi:hypothetical protein